MFVCRLAEQLFPIVVKASNKKTVFKRTVHVPVEHFAVLPDLETKFWTFSLLEPNASTPQKSDIFIAHPVIANCSTGVTPANVETIKNVKPQFPDHHKSIQVIPEIDFVSKSDGLTSNLRSFNLHY